MKVAVLPFQDLESVVHLVGSRRADRAGPAGDLFGTTNRGQVSIEQPGDIGEGLGVRLGDHGAAKRVGRGARQGVIAAVIDVKVGNAPLLVAQEPFVAVKQLDDIGDIAPFGGQSQHAGGGIRVGGGLDGFPVKLIQGFGPLCPLELIADGGQHRRMRPFGLESPEGPVSGDDLVDLGGGQGRGGVEVGRAAVDDRALGILVADRQGIKESKLRRGVGRGGLREPSRRLIHIGIFLTDELEVIKIPVRPGVAGSLLSSLAELSDQGILRSGFDRHADQPAGRCHPSGAEIVGRPDRPRGKAAVEPARGADQVDPGQPFQERKRPGRSIIVDWVRRRVVGVDGFPGGPLPGLGDGAEVIVTGFQSENGAETLRGVGGSIQEHQGLAFPVQGLPVVRPFAEQVLGDPQHRLLLAVAEQAIDRLEDAGGVGLAVGGQPRPEGFRLGHVARLQVELRQSRGRLIAGGEVHQLLLELGGGSGVPFRFGQDRQLMEQLGIAGVGRQQPFQLRARGAKVSRGRISLSQADGHLSLAVGLAPLPFQAGDQAIKLVALEVEGGQASHHRDPGIEIGRLVERSPEHLDRFLGAELRGQGFRQRKQCLGIGLVEPHGAPESIEPLVDLPQLKAQIGEELVVVKLARSGGQKVAPRLERGILAA